MEVDEVKRTKTQRWMMEDSNFRYFTEGDAFRCQFKLPLPKTTGNNLSSAISLQSTEKVRPAILNNVNY